MKDVSGFPDASSIGRRLRRKRRERRMSLGEVAGAVGLTAGSLSRIETGHNTPTLQTLARVCDVIGMPIGDVFKLEPAAWLRQSADGLAANSAGASLRLVSRPGESRVAIFHGVLQGGGQSSVDGAEVGGALVVLAKKGTSIIRVAGSESVLRGGDALTIKSPGLVGWSNGGATPATALWVRVPAQGGVLESPWP